MATGKNKAPWFFNFLKEGFLLPSRNLRLFTAVCALILVSSTLLGLSKDLAVKPLAEGIMVDTKALNATDPGSPDYAKVVQDVLNDTKELMVVGAGYLMFCFLVDSTVRIVVIFAAISTYSGEDRANTTTFGALLGQATSQIKGPLLTLAFVYVLEIFYIVPLTITSSVLSILMVKQFFVTWFVESMFEFFSFLCSFSVVVAVAEPGCHGAGALGKAWRLVKAGKKRQVVLYLALNTALASPVRTLARNCSGYSMALGLLLGFVCAVLRALLQLFEVCAMTALYYKRREDISDTQLGDTRYEKLPTKQANA